jgi:hypothetical protein
MREETLVVNGVPDANSPAESTGTFFTIKYCCLIMVGKKYNDVYV